MNCSSVGMNISCNLDLKYLQSTAIQGLHLITDGPFILHFPRLSATFLFHWWSQSVFSMIVEQNPVLQHVLQMGTTHTLYEGEGGQKTGFYLKKRFIYISNKKHLIPLQNTPHCRQCTCPIFFPTVWSISGTAEAWCWVPPAKLFSPPRRWQISFLSMFFHCRE